MASEEARSASLGRRVDDGVHGERCGDQRRWQHLGRRQDERIRLQMTAEMGPRGAARRSRAVMGGATPVRHGRLEESAPAAKDWARALM